MVRWLEPQKETEPPDRLLMGPLKVPVGKGEITDDPLATIDATISNKRQIYSVSRVNPLFKENMPYIDTYRKPKRNGFTNRQPRQNSFTSADKSGSSGYGSSRISSNFDPLYERVPRDPDAVLIVEQNPNFVKSIRICRQKDAKNSVPSSGSGSSSGTLNTIPEGKVDLTRPKNIWPEQDEKRLEHYDSLVDDALLLYTSLSYMPEIEKHSLGVQISVTELLVDILKHVNSALEGQTDRNPEDVLKIVTNKISLGLEVLKNSTEEDMRKLCVNLRNCKKVNSVLRAFGNSNSSSTSGEWSSNKARSTSPDIDDNYDTHFSSPSSSAFSDSVKDHSDPNLDYDHPQDFGNSRGSLQGDSKSKSCSIRAVNDGKPSVWEQYYGVKADDGIEVQKVVPKPTDVPIFPGGRPEADFTLDVPRSEHLSKKMREDKKWRFRCRVLTGFLGLVFFLLSVMAVSLMLTRGKRMFGSMM
ncbi:uncharacterized protein LOC123308408 isoform X2 [Coccinella septempunctata]|uniref:uncharacterized protein LOC123308408 isoform X2 n=1 Tax=Coccinella septempunctata TaxID=41139 RepID=UPI001D0968B8|nr:uncharacterized protein LOC123308408 isoform X2 [Coccinella septempunctata]